jgi:antitoxin VapB
MTMITRIVREGKSQVVFLPEGFHFDTDEVCIKRIGSAVLLFPKDAAWSLMGDALGKIDEEFMSKRNQPERAEERTGL